MELPEINRYDERPDPFTGTWALNPERTSVTFRTKAMWVLPVKGTAKALAGDAEITPGGAVTGTLVIDAASFDTKNTKRDDHLRSEHLLEVAKYPTIVFKATGGRPVGAGRSVWHPGWGCHCTQASSQPVCRCLSCAWNVRSWGLQDGPALIADSSGVRIIPIPVRSRSPSATRDGWQMGTSSLPTRGAEHRPDHPTF